MEVGKLCISIEQFTQNIEEGEGQRSWHSNELNGRKNRQITINLSINNRISINSGQQGH